MKSRIVYLDHALPHGIAMCSGMIRDGTSRPPSPDRLGRLDPLGAL